MTKRRYETGLIDYRDNWTLLQIWYYSASRVCRPPHATFPKAFEHTLGKPDTPFRGLPWDTPRSERDGHARLPTSSVFSELLSHGYLLQRALAAWRRTQGILKRTAMIQIDSTYNYGIF
ncbi:hypothetical protein M404DRAFT_601219 [Pisolithus tinctorius Marx 270]|uniref:Uncharacterized protein n=1 Tax=Pisolithus tinctorius Marx 270 TaxID=870435 RepID=A0A0C3NT48_PISTI|nr:hypothetical protein M404DRAFT_601219 [Pisolithus tinctorius Marx 270]